MEVTLAKIVASMGANAPAPGPMTFTARSVNLNATGDTGIAIVLPTGYTRYKITDVTVAHASIALSTATLGVYTAVSAGGQAIVTTAALSAITATTDNTAANMLSMTIADTTGSTTAQTLYAHVGTAQGAAATADVSVTIIPLS